MRYYIADTHFFHRSLNEKMDQRGFEDIEQMNEYMIDQWNSCLLYTSDAADEL